MPHIPKYEKPRPWKAPRKPFENKPAKLEGLEGFYTSARWRKTRARVLAKEPLCRVCKEQGLTVAATVVDHITPMNKGGDLLSYDNLQPLCASCHNRKSRFDAE